MWYNFKSCEQSILFLFFHFNFEIVRMSFVITSYKLLFQIHIIDLLWKKYGSSKKVIIFENCLVNILLN